MPLVYPLHKNRRLCSLVKDSVGCSVISVIERLLLWNDAQPTRVWLCAFMFSKRIKHEVPDLHSLPQMLEMSFANYWFLLACFCSTKCDDMVSFWRSRHAFQRLTRLFRTLGMTSDQCSSLLSCLCSARLNSLSLALIRSTERTFPFHAVTWFVLFLPRLHTDVYTILYCLIMLLLWLVFHDNIASPRYYPRQGEFVEFNHLFELKISALDVLQSFLGLKVAIAASGISFSERKCSLELFEEFGLVDCKSVPSSLELNVCLASSVSRLWISFGGSLLFLEKIISRLVIAGCGSATIYATDVFAFTAIHDVVAQPIPQI